MSQVLIVVTLEFLLSRSVGKTIFKREVLSEILAISLGLGFFLPKSMKTSDFSKVPWGVPQAGAVHRRGRSRHNTSLSILIWFK